MSLRATFEWLQKHPTPLGDDGDFRWYPAVADAELRAAIAAGLERDEAIWIAPGRVVWARRFAQTAPADGRRYAGIAAAIVEGDAATPELLAASAPPVAAPWDGDALTREVGVAPALDAAVPGLEAVVDALWTGGVLPPALAAPRVLATVERWLPASVREPARRVEIEERAPDGVPSAVARWLAKAIGASGMALARARVAWRAVQALAAVEAIALDVLVRELEAMHHAWDAEAWARRVHRWGRGDEPPPPDLAQVLARRAVADRMFAIDREAAGRWRRELRRTALVAADRAAALERAVMTRLPALAEGGDGGA